VGGDELADGAEGMRRGVLSPFFFPSACQPDADHIHGEQSAKFREAVGNVSDADRAVVQSKKEMPSFATLAASDWHFTVLD
jgi:hypothetical protein